MSTVCTCKHGHGSSRSVVRQIGNSVPLDTGRRIHVQVSRYSDSPSPVRDQNDYDTTGLTFASHLRNPGHAVFPTEGEEGAGGGMEWGDMASDDSGMETILDGEDEEEGAQTEQKHEALEKISALESELARLKAQIAVYALSEASNIPAAPPPPPPPPMAPPLPPTASSTPAPPPQARVPLSMQGRRRGEFKAPATPAANPNLSHVLQDIGSVKLRSVPSIVRSPGGTPMRRKDQEHREPASNDPAAVIAQALRRKFAHKVFQDSPDKDNLERSSDSSTSGFDSPAGKLFN